MMALTVAPDYTAFLAAPPETVAAVAPPTAVYAVSGSRRRAAMAGIPLDKSYVDWSRPQLVEQIALFFRLGIRHLLVPALGPHQFVEGGLYGEQIIAWCIDVLAGPLMVEEYRQRGWRARFIVPSPLPELRAAGEQLAQDTPGPGPTVRYYFVAAPD